MRNPKILIVGTIVAIIGLFWVGADLFRGAESKKDSTAAIEGEAVLVRDYSPTIGNGLLRVTVVEFLDPECESCRAFHPIMKDILKKYEGRIRYVVRYAPFHGNSKFVIKVLEAARRQGKYWETLDLLFEKLPEWGSHHDPRPDLVWTYLPSLGLDVEKIKVDMEDKAISDMIEQEIKDGAKLRVRGTPTFFVNGKLLESFGPEYLLEAIEAELK